MPTKYYRNVENEEVVTVAEGAVDLYADEIIADTTNNLYREISAVEAGVGVKEAEEAPVEE